MKKQEARPQLTISILISNRPDTIRRCLDSLETIRREIPSELILIDTSQNPDIHEILLEYTSDVYPFVWCKDFAKARNEGLRRAKGEWFLFLDDDEWFVETDELIAFFTSGEYRSYGYANYQVRNFYDPAYTYYSDSWVSRMIRIDPDTRFRSKIHEYMYPVRGKCRHIYSIAYHSGYIYQTEEQKRAHFERNSSLLLEMIEEEPENLRWQAQLVQEYRSVKEWDRLIAFCQKGLEATSHIDEKYANVHLGTFYAGYSEALVFQKDYPGALEICERGLNDSRNTKLCKSLLHLRMAECLLKLEDYANSLKCLMCYLQEEKTIGKDEDLLNFQKMALLVNEVYDELNIKKAYSIWIANDLRQGSTRILNEYYEMLGWNSTVIYVQDGTEKYFVEAMAKLPCEPIFVRMVTDAFSNREFRKLMCQAANEWETDVSGWKKILSVYAQTDLDDWYICYAKAILAYENGDADSFCAEVAHLFESADGPFEVPDVLYRILEENEIAIADCWNLIPSDLWKAVLEQYAGETDEEKQAEKAQRIKNVLGSEDWRYQYFMEEKARQDGDTEAVLKFYENYIQMQYLKEDPVYLPEHLREFFGVEKPDWMSRIDALQKRGILALEQARSQYADASEMTALYFQKAYATELIRLESENESYDKLYARFESFCHAVLAYYERIYTKKAFEGTMPMLSGEIRSAVYLKAMCDCSGQDRRRRIELLRLCAREYPMLGNNIKKLAHWIGEQEKVQNTTAADRELQQIAEVMKKKIALMIEQGMKAEALSVLSQVQALLPEDAELLQMAKELSE